MAFRGARLRVDRALVEDVESTNGPATASDAPTGAGAIARVVARSGSVGRLGPAGVATLQGLAGNGAVATLFAPARIVQRDVEGFLKGTAAGKATSGSIGTTAGKRSIAAHFFPGTSSEKALVVGGVHGSELSGIAVAEELVRRLSAPGARAPFFSVVIVPSLFPDNVARRRDFEAKLKGPLSPDDYAKAAAEADDPGRKTPGQEDPNRQMPMPGTAFDPKNPVDAAGRVIEVENQALLELIRRFQPVRIASLHAIKDASRAGVFADPHPSVAGADAALAGRMDALALDMARKAAAGGARVAGNRLRGKAGGTSLYPGQDPKRAKDQIERENRKGTSLGQWGPSRGIGVLTIELPQQYDTSSPVADPTRGKEIAAHAEALQEIFLGPTPEALLEAVKGVGAAIGAAAGAVAGSLGSAAAMLGLGAREEQR
ncbi:MAG TPA: hypothetical protein VK871_15430 [Candidatus Limnocylindrales bacterium]|nr:hypothetical protein [Candidatus Limnocylindrales bacterium]